jgi:hypothetical protein
MSKKIFQFSAVFFLLLSLITPILSRQLVCRTKALAALKPFPKLKYKCREALDDYDERILKYPERRVAINRYVKMLENFTTADWWKADLEDLRLCDFRKKSGVFSEDETENYKQGYFPDLMGSNQFRMISVADPCFQTNYNGANIFLLYRKNGKVFASEIFDGYFSRADYGPGTDVAMLNNEPIIEISMIGGGISPIEIYYYFTIDKKTSKAVPKNIFFDENHKPSNRIDSYMLMEDSENYGLPPNLEGPEIIKNGLLMKSVDIFKYAGETDGEEKHEKFERLTLRWNGKFYE